MTRSQSSRPFVTFTALGVLTMLLAATLATAQEEAPPADDNPVVEGSGGDADAATLAMGLEAFASNCTRCHGEDGQATSAMAQRMNVPAFTTARFTELGADGLTASLGTAHGERNPAAALSEEQVAAVVAYIQTLAQ